MPRRSIRHRPHQTQGALKYGIREIRLRPGKLAKRYRDQDQEKEAAKEKQSNAHRQTSGNATQEWASYKNILGEAMRQIYPLSNKQTWPGEAECVTELEEWGKNTKYAN